MGTKKKNSNGSANGSVIPVDNNIEILSKKNLLARPKKL